MADQRRIVVAVTGAGGTRLAGGFLRKLVADERVGHVDLMVSANARKIMAFEHGSDQMDVRAFDYSSFSDLMDDATQSGSSVKFKFASGTGVTVLDTTIDDFSSSDFLL